MSVWSHAHASRRSETYLHESEIDRVWFDEQCLYCRSTLTNLFDEPDDLEALTVRVCGACGWWIEANAVVHPAGWCDVFGNRGVLKNLDLADLSTPLDEVRRYLVAKFERRFDMHPRLFEHVVADMMKDFGYEAEVTAYSGDGGIDVILRDAEGVVGIQVKRYRDKIKVEQIRSLTGALVLAGETRGIFVSTSEFQPGAIDAARRAAGRGIAIELIDAERFLSALEITARPPYETLEQWRDVVGEPATIEIGGYLAH